MKRIMTSSWSLHRTLGEVMYDWSETRGTPKRACGGEGEISLLQVPGQLAKRDIGMLEICHFHLPQTEGAYIRELRSELDAHEIDLYSVLIDAGDVAHPDPEQRACEVIWVREWLELAAELGARCARVIAGDAPPAGSGPIEDDPVVCASAESFRELARSARQLGIGLSTENFRSLGCHVDALSALLDRCEGEVGLCADFGNFKGPEKYADLSVILPRATSVHAKADFYAEGQMDRADFTRCLELARDAQFDGPYSLIFSSPGDEWEGLAHTRAVVDEYVGV